LFISIEGIEASGKSTLQRGLAETLAANGADIVVTHEPGGTPLGSALRAVFLDPATRIDPAAEVLLLNASRAQLVAEILQPALARGAVVLCDRFLDSTLAYQGYGRGMSLEFLKRVIHEATGGLEPDVTLLLDVPVALSRERLAARGSKADRLESEGIEFHERVRNGFLTLAAQTGRVRVLDGRRPPNELIALAWNAVQPQLSIR
jgi:dTMP kinase